MITLKDFYKKLYPLDAIKTLGYFLVKDKQFIDEVLSGNWRKKLKPAPFFAGCFLFYLLIIGAFNTTIYTVNWYKGFYRLDLEEQQRFENLLQIKIKPYDYTQLSWGIDAEVNDTIRRITGTSKLGGVAKYLESKGDSELAFKFLSEGKKSEKFNRIIRVIERLG